MKQDGMLYVILSTNNKFDSDFYSSVDYKEIMTLKRGRTYKVTRSTSPKTEEPNKTEESNKTEEPK